MDQSQHSAIFMFNVIHGKMLRTFQSKKVHPTSFPDCHGDARASYELSPGSTNQMRVSSVVQTHEQLSKLSEDAFARSEVQATMSNKLITDTFPKAKKERQINQKLRQTKPKSTDKSVIQDDKELTTQKELAILKDFDLNPEYGPCIGITRKERWDRAEKYGLQPPEEVREILRGHSDVDDTTFTECIWYDTVI